MKQAISPQEAAAMIPDQATILIGGFMGVGSAHRVIDAIVEAAPKGLTVVCNDAGRADYGMGKLVTAGLVTKAVVSHIGLNPNAQKQMLSGDLEVELCPQGTLVERIRAGGVGLGGVLTRTGLGTLVEEGKQVIEVKGERFLLEPPIKGDFAIIAAHQSDYLGNLDYSLTAHNFNPIMAMAGETVIAEPHTIVPIGVIPPDTVKTPGVLVDHIIKRAA